MVETEHRVIKVVVSKPRVIKHRVDKGSAGSAAAADGRAERLGVTLARHLQALKVHDGHLSAPPSDD
ncbi:hypothetical protein [Streptomyces lydicus]|uniref:hypothetical protein n=1 Tax=Streptomyces lydicus TaxID=47763 RepID=UPI002870A0CA|nr:hypothetical protein [Streptomyces lydicus]